jgi:hypothetical protein
LNKESEFEVLGPFIALECSIEADSVVPLFCRDLKSTNIQSNFQRAIKTESANMEKLKNTGCYICP